jgi:SAM-dependent methyltransferase
VSFVAVDAYDRFVGRYSRELAGRLVDFAGLERGMRALDVGCGPGALTRVLAERLGGENVAAVEPSAPFAAACRERNPGVEVEIAFAEELPFGDDVFDAALSQLAFNFLADAETGVREMARVTRPGGAVAACVWDFDGGMTLLTRFWAAAAEVVPEGSRADDERGAARWCREGELEGLFRAAGVLHDVRGAQLVVSAGYENFDDLWWPFPQGIGPAGAFAASLDDATQAKVRDAYREHLGVGDGPFELTAKAWAAAGTA